MGGAVRGARSGGRGREWRSGDDPAVRNAEAIAELEGGAADDDLLVPQLVQRFVIAAQHVDVGHLRNGRGVDTEIDQEGRALRIVLPRQHRAHRRQELPAEILTEVIAPDQTVRLDRNIHSRRPRMIAELPQRTIEMDRRSVATVASQLLEGRQDHGSTGGLKRLSKYLV